MKRIFLLFTLTALCITNFNAQQLENSTLWKIEGNGLDKPSYLFGTIHITCDATLDDDVKKALDETSLVVLELDMDDPNMQAEMMKSMYMSDNKTIQDLVSPEDFASIDSLFIKNMGMSVKMLQNVKPFFLTASLYPKLLDCPMQSFESELIKVAKAQNEEVMGLESIDDQMQIFEDIPYEVQIKDLVRSAKDNLAYDKATFTKLLEMYKSEDINAMIDMMNDENYTSIAQYQDKLLDNRNKNWIPIIADYAKKQPTFFGVGAAHLAGENGVVNLLRSAGYNVTAVLN
ncbi:TraB/GumN family protein [Winogradskyella aurantia]|uniref:TraB/GumN family protein n=1 Tax=Winogradskyella aurantia TaxID=1915063 RepID=A0A265UNF2_9FLAO|nr:TraB/GumN family protein [Winogradskyella aurantia]OZV66607.1 TraB/GumN family protein [Winogradskyella aurantia]